MKSHSDNLINYDRLMRPLKCVDCLEEFMDNQPNPICPYCSGIAVTIIKSALTNERIRTPRGK